MIIEKKFVPLQPFVIPLSGLAQGGTQFDWRADGTFFGNSGNSEILAADLGVTVHVEKSMRFFGVDGTNTGKVTVLCDRCLEELELPVDTGFKLSVKFGESAETADAGDREIVMIPEGSQELDLSQFVYDYTCISLPMRRVHPEGECNPEALKYLSTEESAGDAPSAGSPFAALKDILK